MINKITNELINENFQKYIIRINENEHMVVLLSF